MAAPVENPTTLPLIPEGFERLAVDGSESGEWDIPSGIVPTGETRPRLLRRCVCIVHWDSNDGLPHYTSTLWSSSTRSGRQISPLPVPRWRIYSCMSCVWHSRRPFNCLVSSPAPWLPCKTLLSVLHHSSALGFHWLDAKSRTSNVGVAVQTRSLYGFRTARRRRSAW